MRRAQCYCGNTDPSEDLSLEESQCETPCSGDKEEICGGYWTINIYTINYDLTPQDVQVGPPGNSDDQTFSWNVHSSGDEEGLACSGDSVSISSFAYPQYFIAKCKNDLVIVNKPEWNNNFCNESDFDLFQDGCWSIETASNIYYLELFASEGSRGYDWIENQIQYRPENENYELLFAAETGTNNPESFGDIAIDDIYVYYGECLSEGVCSFESPDICGFSQDETDTDDWTVGSFFEDNSDSAPPYDHTSQGQLSRSVYFQNYRSNESLFSASILSPQYEPFEAGCLTFWYYMWSDLEDQNMTFTVSFNAGDPEWFRFGRMKAGWERASVDVVTEEATQLVFKVEGKNEPGHVKTVAFDDYEVDRSGFCFDMEQLTCDFETKTFCHWKNLEDDALDWLLTTADTESEPGQGGPATDHTTGTDLGHFLYIVQDHSVRGETAVLESSIAIAYPYTPACFSFWSYMYGNNNGRLAVLKVSTITQMEEVVFYKVESLDREWKFHQIDLPNGELANFYYLRIVVFSENSQQSTVIAVDDFIFEMESCPSPPPDKFKCSDDEEISMAKKCDFVIDCSNGLDELECGDCDFEAGWCGWSIPYLPSMFSWNRTQFNGTGPTVDHTVGDETGWYVLAHQENSDQYLDETILMSPVLMQTFSSCKLTFWLFLQSENKSTTLEVSGQQFAEERTIYYQDNHKHSEWTYVEAHLDRQHSPFYIFLVGYPELGGDSDLAIDDVEYKDCKFPDPSENCSEFQCANKVCVAVSEVCDNTDNCGDDSDEAKCTDYQLCHFEAGLCAWQNTNDTGSKFSWGLTTVEDRKDGPTRDHSLNTRYGTFLSVDQTSASKESQQIRLASSVLSTQGGCQVTFYVYVSRNSKTSLRVKTREAVGGPETDIFNQTETREFEYWLKKTAKIDNSLTAFQIIFEVETQSNSKAGIFLDDVILSPECKKEDVPLPTVTNPPPTTTDPCYFRCGDKCLEQEKVCNFHSDCANGEDELHCAQCDFESDFCGWDATSGSDSSGWLRWRGEDDLANSVTPSGDHDNKYDTFFLLALISGAELFSPMIGGSGEACQMNFWYSSFNASHELKMQVLQEEQVLKEEIFPGHEESWTNVDVGLDISGSYQLYFEVTYPSGLDINLIAIDDLTFSGCDALNPPPAEISCDFESGLCGWSQVTGGDQADWTRDNTGTWYENTGPGYDHTTGDGYYVYFSSHGHQAGDSARLVSPALSHSGTACLSFWYHLYGEDLDTVNFNLIMDDVPLTLWTKFSTQGNIWKKAQVDIPSFTDVKTQVFVI